MAAKLTEKFFDRWKGLPPEKKVDCPPDHILVALVKEQPREAKWTEHVNACDQCGTIVELLRATTDAPGRNLQEFLAMTKARSQEVALDRPVSTLTYLSAFFSISRARQVGVYAIAAVAFLTLALTLADKQFGILSPKEHMISVSFDEDKYGKTIQQLRASSEELRPRIFSRGRIEALIGEINIELSEVYREQLKPEERAELASLVAEFQALINEKYSRRPVVQIAENADSKKVEDLYKIYAIYDQPAYGQIEVKRIEGQEVLVKDLIQNRSPARKDAAYLAMQEFSNKSNTLVRFQSGSVVKTFLPVRQSTPQP